MQISLSSSLIKETDLVLPFYQIVRLNATAKVPSVGSCSGRVIQWDREEYSTEQVVQSDGPLGNEGGQLSHSDPAPGWVQQYAILCNWSYWPLPGVG